MTPARKITDEQHAERMAKRTAKRATLRAPRHYPEVRKGGPPFNDGFDQARLDRAAQKAARRARR